MTFAAIIKYVLMVYVLYYFAIIMWDSVFGTKKKEDPEEEVSFDISSSVTEEEQPVSVVEEDSDYLQKKKIIDINNPPSLELDVKGNSAMTVTELLRSLEVQEEAKGLFSNMNGI